MQWTPGHLWEITVEFPANELIEYKYVVLGGIGPQRWELGCNRQVLLHNEEMVLEDVFRP